MVAIHPELEHRDSNRITVLLHKKYTLSVKSRWWWFEVQVKMLLLLERAFST